MSKNFERKKEVVKQIKEKFENAQSAVVVDYRGLNVADATELRNRFREANVEYRVLKNNLVKLAIKDTDFEALSVDLTGPNAFAFGIDDAVAPAKIVKEFSKTNPHLELKSGVVEKVYYDTEGILEIANLPSKEELIGRFMGSIKAPISNFAYFLTNLAKEKEEGTGEAVEA
ncbi:MAG: 50S ribosomal protein L10 [Clostridiales bacterium]|nr:MAG: 50S ribosomal protein L10 [Clostridiales bacterium]